MASGNIHHMDQRDLLTLESAVTAIEEAASAVASEVERDRRTNQELDLNLLRWTGSTVVADGDDTTGLPN